jgi:hypothetical protein
MIETRENNSVKPLCPHCSKPLGEVWLQGLQSTLGRRYVYFCPECHKVLGVSQRKGFWMG